MKTKIKFYKSQNNVAETFNKLKQADGNRVLSQVQVTQLAGVAEYTNYISAEVSDSSNEWSEYDTKQSDGEVPVMLELWRKHCTPLFPWLLCPLWPGVVAPDRVLSVG